MQSRKSKNQDSFEALAGLTRNCFIRDLRRSLPRLGEPSAG